MPQEYYTDGTPSRTLADDQPPADAALRARIAELEAALRAADDFLSDLDDDHYNSKVHDVIEAALVGRVK